MMSMLRMMLRGVGMQAMGGLCVWLLVVVAALVTWDPALDLIGLLLLFGQLVIVPLGLPLLRARRGLEHNLLLGARWFFRIGALAALAAILMPHGQLWAAVTALYLLPALTVGVAALVRGVRGLLDGSVWRASELARIGASGFLVVGALFFVLHRQGGEVLGVSEVIVQLTAVHFHFTGFGLLLIAGRAVERTTRGASMAVLLLLAGMIVTPVGFLTIAVVQVAGALLVVGGLWATAGALVRRRSVWLRISAVSALLFGGLAAMYAIGEAFGRFDGGPALSDRTAVERGCSGADRGTRGRATSRGNQRGDAAWPPGTRCRALRAHAGFGA